MTSNPFYIVNGKKCMTILASDPINGTPIVSSDCVEGNKQQQFTYDSTSKEIMYNTGTGNKCIDLNMSDTKNGSKIQLWDCSGAPYKLNQQWNFGTNNITSQVNANKCIDLPMDSQVNGTPLQIWDCLGNVDQKFVQQQSISSNSGKKNFFERIPWYVYLILGLILLALLFTILFLIFHHIESKKKIYVGTTY